MAIKLSLKTLFGGYALIVTFVLITTGLFLVHAGSLLNLGFPLLAASLAFYLFFFRRHIYVAFVWWIWLFTPLVRRLVDYQTGYHAISPVMLTPILVTAFAFLPLLVKPRFILKRSHYPFLLLVIVYLYALVVGAISNGVAAALFNFAGSADPLAFGLFLMSDYKGFAENRKAFMFSSNLGLLLISAYGLYQFFHMPPWDAYWLEASKFASAGPAIAEQVRLFGPCNAPGVYGAALMTSLVYVLVTKGPLRIAAGGLGFPAFGLSLVRSAWGGWVIAVAVLIFFSGGKTRLRLISLGFVLALFAFPIVTVGPVADTLSKRFATFNNIQQDGSFKQRQNLYETSTLDAFSNPIGSGYGASGISLKLSGTAVTGFDSGLLQIPFEFGWIFGALFVWAMLAIGLNVTEAARKTSDNIVIASAGLFVAVNVQNIGAPVWDNVFGMAMWASAAFALGPVTAFVPRKIQLSSALGLRQLALPRSINEN